MWPTTIQSVNCHIITSPIVYRNEGKKFSHRPDAGVFRTFNKRFVIQSCDTLYRKHKIYNKKTYYISCAVPIYTVKLTTLNFKSTYIFFIKMFN